MPFHMTAGRVSTTLLAAALLASAGCEAAPYISVSSLTDAAHQFPPADNAAATVVVWRAEEPGVADERAAADNDRGRIVPESQLTLEERHLLAGVREGLAVAGFAVWTGDASVSSSSAASSAYHIVASLGTVSGEYDTIRRVPVTQSTWGYVQTRHGLRDYYGTTTTDVIVPERRHYVHRIITLSAIPEHAVSGRSAALSPALPSVVWRGRVVGDANVIDAGLAHHVATLIEDWGRSAQRKVKYEPDQQ